MERLTARTEHGRAYLVNVKPDEQEVESPYKNTLQCILDCFERLARYEDAEEQGLLVVLPCKVGDTVYHRSGQHTIDDIQLFYPRQNGHVPEERIGKLQIRLGSLNYAGLQTFATYADEIGKTVFLTREAAEAALEKQEGAEHERD